MSRFGTNIWTALLAFALIGCGDGYDSTDLLTTENTIPSENNVPNENGNPTNGSQEPTACPAGVTCTTDRWGAPTKKLSLQGNTILAIKIETTEAGLSGMVQTAYTSGVSGNREVAFSTQPGNFNVPKECVTSGTTSTANHWHQGPGGKIYECELPTNAVIYLNIRHTYCESLCEFYLAF